ncbi:unnamed protein product [Gulo gulo]|uniref:Uncharacterized protein n=1 Tax=Gulo gulo TaxID=48420 RepID=A0A9X9LEV2_GULGU|nr:unnamed protein product [Gulo gulo]
MPDFIYPRCEIRSFWGLVYKAHRSVAQRSYSSVSCPHFGPSVSSHTPQSTGLHHIAFDHFPQLQDRSTG